MDQAQGNGLVRLMAAPHADAAVPGGTSMPHVLLALDQFSATLGGGERVALRLARLLPSWGFRVSILTLSLDTRSPALLAPPCPIYFLPLQRTWDLSALRAAFALRQFLREQKTVLVQTFFESSDLWTGTVAKTVPGVRLLWSRRDMGILRDRKHEIAYKLLRRLPDRVLAVSEEVRRHCIEVDGISPGLVETLYNGIDLAARPDATNAATGQPTVMGKPERRTVISVGNVRPVKGFHVLLEAAVLVLKRFPDVTFRIAGEILDRGYHHAMVARAREAGISDRFLFAGNVTDVRGFLQGGDIFVLPSLSEGFSNAIVEAMACSLPVVATRAGGNAEAVLDGVTGLIVPPDAPDELAEALCRLLAEPALATAMGATGYDRATERFTTDAMLSHLTRIYRSVLMADAG